MAKNICLIFAYRDRDQYRIVNSMNSLKTQTDKGFQVVFVDYGSSQENSHATRKTLSNFTFVDYFYVAHPGLLWNKSKAFNYGIKKSESEYIVTADIDIIFHPNFVEKAKKLASHRTYTVFSYAYLQKQETQGTGNREFSKLKPSHIGYITGSGLYPRVSLERVHGLDEFYHFYGSEDEDLFIRLESYGLKKNQEPCNLLAHQWHPRYPFEEKNELSRTPKIHNIRRINMAHYENARDSGRIVPNNQENWGECFRVDDQKRLSSPDYSFQIDSREAQVSHFLNERLGYLKGVVHAQFTESMEKKSARNLIKKLAGRKSEPVLSLKEINDHILKTIIYRYRHYNYEFNVDLEKRCILLKIDLKGE